MDAGTKIGDTSLSEGSLEFYESLPGAGDYEIRLYANNSYELLADATFSIGGDAPPAINIVRNGNGTITVTFEGKLQTAATVNSPWQDVDSVSPLTLNTDETVHFVRAVR